MPICLQGFRKIVYQGATFLSSATLDTNCLMIRIKTEDELFEEVTVHVLDKSIEICSSEGEYCVPRNMQFTYDILPMLKIIWNRKGAITLQNVLPSSNVNVQKPKASLFGDSDDEGFSSCEDLFGEPGNEVEIFFAPPQKSARSVV